MQLSTTSKKIFKWLAVLLGALILLLVVASIYVNAKWKPVLTEKLKEAVYNGSSRLYKLDFKDVHVNLVNGNLTLDSILLIPDSSVYDSLKLAKEAPAHIFEVKVAKLQLSRVGILTAYFKKHIKVNTLLLENPSINMLYSRVSKKQDTVAVKKTLYELISKDIKLIQVKNIKVVDADFDYYNKSVSKQALNSVKKLNIIINDFLIDSVAENDTSRYFYSKNFSYNLVNYTSISKDKMYQIKVDSVYGNANAKNIKVVGFKVIPQYDELTFSRKYKTQKDRYDLAFNKIEARGLDLHALIEEGKLRVKNIEIGPAKVAVFMNRELPPPNFNKGRNFPHLALKRLNIETIVDTLALNNVDVAYTEYSEETKKKGTIKLDDLSGTIINVTNDSLRLIDKGQARANLNTKIMGTGNLNVKINFHLNDPNGRFDYSGTLGNMDLKILNPLSVNLGMIRIESGSVKQLNFNASANWNGANGNLTMLYSDLKVEMLRKEDNVVKKKGLLSFLANNILIISNNPKDTGGTVRTGKIAFERPMTSSFFNLLWKGVFTGVRETVGIGMIPMKSPPQPIGNK